MALAAGALACIALLAARREVALLLPAFLAFGIARPIATVAASAGTVAAISRSARGLSSSLVTQARQLGAVLGVAVLGLVLTGIEIERRNQLLHATNASVSHRRREALDGILAGSSQARELLAALTPAGRHAVSGAASSAFMSGFRAAMLVAALVAAAAALASGLLVRPARVRRRSDTVAAATAATGAERRSATPGVRHPT
jgi:hypothetical protein